MHKKSIILTCLSFIVIAALLAGCAGMMAKPTKQNFKPPVVTLDSVEIAHYWGWWYFKKTIKPTMGTAGDYGAPLDLAFIFNVQNPNPYPVMLEELKFTVAFEEFDLNTPAYLQPQWIPGGKINQVRVHAMFDGRQSLLSLLVTGGFKLEQKVGKAGPGPALKQLEKWWEEIPEYSVPIHVKGGSAIFKADNLTQVATFKATFP